MTIEDNIRTGRYRRMLIPAIASAMSGRAVVYYYDDRDREQAINHAEAILGDGVMINSREFNHEDGTMKLVIRSGGALFLKPFRGRQVDPFGTDVYVTDLVRANPNV